MQHRYESMRHRSNSMQRLPKIEGHRQNSTRDFSIFAKRRIDFVRDRNNLFHDR